MQYALILVEGQTEETFVNTLLQPHLVEYGVFLTPTILTTKRTPSKSYKGGIKSYQHLKNELELLSTNRSACCITTMIDFYGLADKGFPGWDTKRGNCYQQVDHVEAAFQADIVDHRFVPYLALHEYEALLFTDPAHIVYSQPNAQRYDLEALQAICDDFESPETINHADPPSKRILSIFPRYRKIADGTAIAESIGISAIRKQCPHFNDWLHKLESL